MNGRQTYNPTEQEVHSPMRDTAESSVLYSFDVFDTVLCRACVEPEGVFKYVQQEMERSESLFDSRFRRRYVSTRRWAEEICREVKRRERTNARATCDGPTLVPTEISFDEIFECMEWVYGLDRQQTDLLKEWELAAERRFSMPVEHNVRRVKDLMEAGEEVVFISDMYLPETFVRELLTAADDSFEDVPLFLSSSIGLQKSTGELYDYIARTRGRSYDSWIHVGDNPTADVRRPRKLGIKAERYDPGVSFGPYERALADSLGTCDALLAAGLFARFASDGASVEDDFAYRYASLYFVPYIEWVLAHALDQGVECLYFICRHPRLLIHPVVPAAFLPFPFSIFVIFENFKRNIFISNLTKKAKKIFDIFRTVVKSTYEWNPDVHVRMFRGCFSYIGQNLRITYACNTTMFLPAYQFAVQNQLIHIGKEFRKPDMRCV